jgi:hypothetical protein
VSVCVCVLCGVVFGMLWKERLKNVRGQKKLISRPNGVKKYIHIILASPICFSVSKTAKSAAYIYCVYVYSCEVASEFGRNLS